MVRTHAVFRFIFKYKTGINRHIQKQSSVQVTGLEGISQQVSVFVLSLMDSERNMESSERREEEERQTQKH